MQHELVLMESKNWGEKNHARYVSRRLVQYGILLWVFSCRERKTFSHCFPVFSSSVTPPGLWVADYNLHLADGGDRERRHFSRAADQETAGPKTLPRFVCRIIFNHRCVKPCFPCPRRRYTVPRTSPNPNISPPPPPISAASPR